MPEQSERSDLSMLLRKVWPWALLPSLPLWGGLVLIKLLYDRKFAVTDFIPNAKFIDAAGIQFLHMKDLIVYSSFAYLHVVICVAAIIYFIIRIRTLDIPTRGTLWALAGVLFLLLVITTYITRTDNTAQQLTYANVCEMLISANVATHILAEECRGGSPSILFMLASLPTAFGLIATLFAAAIASISALPFPPAETREFRDEFSKRSTMIIHAFYVTSALLVTSTIAIKLFLELPLSLAADDATRAAISNGAQAMTAFWGTVFTLTLVSIFAPAGFHLYRLVRGYGLEAGETTAELADWLNAQILSSAPKQLASLIAFLAPILVGPVAGLLKDVLG